MLLPLFQYSSSARPIRLRDRLPLDQLRNSSESELQADRDRHHGLGASPVCAVLESGIGWRGLVMGRILDGRIARVGGWQGRLCRACWLLLLWQAWSCRIRVVRRGGYPSEAQLRHV